MSERYLLIQASNRQIEDSTPISGQVLFHQPGSPSFTYNDDLGNIHWNPRFNQYYFEASLELLDNPGEWFFNVTTGVLYLIPPSGKCPDTSSKNLRGRTLDYGLTITNTTGLTVANLTFLAATIDGHSEDRGPYIDEICLDSVDFLFQSSSHRMLGSDSLPKVSCNPSHWFPGDSPVCILQHPAPQDSRSRPCCQLHIHWWRRICSSGDCRLDMVDHAENEIISR